MQQPLAALRILGSGNVLWRVGKWTQGLQVVIKINYLSRDLDSKAEGVGVGR